nr:sigma-70 family RNA polymerase sigma factor [Kofleriaceae bacterium]
MRDLLAADHADRAATEVISRLGAEVYGFLRASLGSEPDADDVFAATCERLWRGLATFRWQCSLRTWIYVIARNEAARFASGAKRRNAGRTSPSQLEEVAAVIRTETKSVLRTHKRDKFRELRDELPADDRMLLILRVDRDLPWDDVARAFLADDGEPATDELVREAARLRKRFQLVKQRLATRAREEGLGS